MLLHLQRHAMGGLRRVAGRAHDGDHGGIGEDLPSGAHAGRCSSDLRLRAGSAARRPVAGGGSGTRRCRPARHGAARAGGPRCAPALSAPAGTPAARRSRPVELAVAGDAGAGTHGPASRVPLPGAGPQVQRQRRHAGRAGGGDGRRRWRRSTRRCRVSPGRIGAISTLTAKPASASVRTASSRRRGLAYPARPTATALVDEADRDREADRCDLGGLAEQWQVAQDQRALGEDRERVGEVAQRRDDAPASAGSGPRPAGSSPRWCPSRCARPRQRGAASSRRSSSPALTLTTTLRSKSRRRRGPGRCGCCGRSSRRMHGSSPGTG